MHFDSSHSILGDRIVIKALVVSLANFFMDKPSRDSRSKESEEDHIKFLHHSNHFFTVGKVKPEEENATD